MRTLLICHEGAQLDEEVLARWLASFSELVGVVVLRETGGRMRQRVRREIKRVGYLRFLDVLAFRLHYKLFRATDDARWERETIEKLCAAYPPLRDVPTLATHSPNSKEAAEFIKSVALDVMIARCKTILKEEIFTIPKTGTFVMHPGVCPEYRNAHGCFWALAQRDFARVGMTLLKIDKGVDTGPVYGYYSYPFDAARESHIRIQARVVLENLDALRQKLEEIHTGCAERIDTRGRSSVAWGQPWLTKHLQIMREARRAANAGEEARPA